MVGQSSGNRDYPTLHMKIVHTPPLNFDSTCVKLVSGSRRGIFLKIESTPTTFTYAVPYLSFGHGSYCKGASGLCRRKAYHLTEWV